MVKHSVCRYRAGHLVLVAVPVGPAGGQLAAQLAGAAPVLVDEVVQGHVGARRLPVSDDQGAVNVCSVMLSSLSIMGWPSIVFHEIHLLDTLTATPHLSPGRCPAPPP